jgi:flagellar motility protein MotE (MotC chaperone)
MTTRIASPFSLSLVGLLAGVAAGLGWFWVRADCIAEIALARAHFPGKTADKAKGWEFWTIEIDSLASELKDEKARVRTEEEQLDLRTARMASDRLELDKLRTELNAMHQGITDSVVEIQADEAKNLRMLSQTYSNLSPHGAVAIIRELDDTTAVKILSLMKPDVIGPIFEDMTLTSAGPSEAHRAAVLSERLRLVKAQKTASTP